MSASSSIAFQRIKPRCVELSTLSFLPRETFDPNSVLLLEKLRSLERELAKFEDEQLTLSPKFADYVFVPLGSLLHQESLGEAHTECLLLTIGHLVKLCWTSVGTFPQALAQQLFPLITFLISANKENSELMNKPTSFQLAGCVVLKKIFDALALQRKHQVFNYFANPENLPS